MPAPCALTVTGLTLTVLVLGITGCGEEPVETGSMPLLDAAGVQAQIKGLEGKPVLINLWATWCAPCMEELPELESASETIREAGGEVIGLNLDMLEERFQLKDQSGKVQRAAERRELTFPIWMWKGGDKAALGKALAIEQFQLPTTLAITAGGKVVETHIGQADGDKFESLFEAAKDG